VGTIVVAGKVPSLHALPDPRSSEDILEGFEREFAREKMEEMANNGT
jgi:hypothetical protein